ncbi:MAG: sulfotransferase [Pirellulaceae bacterium]|nr:sulfotransferase [Planctomycetales bacterium]
MSGKKRSNRRSKARIRGIQWDDVPGLQHARELWIGRRYSQSLSMFAEAVRRHPANVIALTDAARAFGSRFEFAEAERYLERLLELGGHRADVLQMVGQSYRMIQRPQRAREMLQKAIALDENLFLAHLELAMLYERCHGLDEAERMVEQALLLQPTSAEARFLTGRLQRRAGQLDRAIVTLQTVVDDEIAHWETRVRSLYELGQLYDEREEYDRAIEAVTDAKRIAGQHAQTLRKQAEREYTDFCSLLATLTPADVQRWRELADREQPQRVALLTGAPRSGTTLLEKVLAAHPDIVTSDEQEAFAKFIYPAMLQLPDDQSLQASSLTDIETQNWTDQRHRYLRYLEGAMQEPIAGRVCIDKNPSTIPLIPGMLRLFPEMKLIVALRDPRDVVVSCFMQHLPLNSVSAQFLTLPGVVDRVIRDAEGWWRLRAIIGQDWMEVRYEDLVNDLEGMVRKTLTSLDLNWDEKIMDYRQRLRNEPVRSPTYEAVAKPIYRSSIGRWRNYERYLEPFLDRLKPIMTQGGWD